MGNFKNYIEKALFPTSSVIGKDKNQTELANNQIGIFDFDTGLSLDATSSGAKKIYFVWKNSNGVSVESAGVYKMLDKNFEFSQRDYQGGRVQIDDISIGNVVEDADYTLKIEALEHQSHTFSGVRQPVEQFNYFSIDNDKNELIRSFVSQAAGSHYSNMRAWDYNKRVFYLTASTSGIGAADDITFDIILNKTGTKSVTIDLTTAMTTPTLIGQAIVDGLNAEDNIEASFTIDGSGTNNIVLEIRKRAIGEVDFIASDPSFDSGSNGLALGTGHTSGKNYITDIDSYIMTHKADNIANNNRNLFLEITSVSIEVPQNFYLGSRGYFPTEVGLNFYFLDNLQHNTDSYRVQDHRITSGDYRDLKETELRGLSSEVINLFHMGTTKDELTFYSENGATYNRLFIGADSSDLFRVLTIVVEKTTSSANIITTLNTILEALV